MNELLKRMVWIPEVGRDGILDDFYRCSRQSRTRCRLQNQIDPTHQRPRSSSDNVELPFLVVRASRSRNMEIYTLFFEQKLLDLFWLSLMLGILLDKSVLQNMAARHLYGSRRSCIVISALKL